MILAAENDAVEVVAALLAAGAALDLQRLNGDTALMAACAHGWERSVGTRRASALLVHIVCVCEGFHQKCFLTLGPALARTG